MKKALLLFISLSIACLNFACQSTVRSKTETKSLQSDVGSAPVKKADSSDRFYDTKFALKTAGEAAIIIPATIFVIYAVIRAGGPPNVYEPKRNESQENFNEWILRR